MNSAEPAQAETTDAADLRLEYDADELRASVCRDLDDLEAELSSGARAEVLGPATLHALREQLVEIRERAGGSLKVVVLGEFKRGKSTLVNALLGRVVAPADVLPETLTINEYSYSQEFRAFLRVQGGARLPLNEADIARSSLTRLLERVGGRISHLDVRGPFPELQGIVLVDTPGTGDLAQDVENRLREYLAQADVVIVVVSVSSPFSQSEQALLRTAIAPHEFARICFVLNMTDTVRDAADVDRMATHLKLKVGREFPGANVYPLSALDEVARITGEARPVPGASERLEASFAEFRAELSQLVSVRAHAIQLERTLHLAGSALREIDARIGLLDRALGGRVGELEALASAQSTQATQEQEMFVRQVAALRQRMDQLGEVAAGWMSAFVDRLLAQLPSQLQAISKPDVERDFPFFLGDALRAALESCFDAHTEELQQIAREGLGADAAFARDAAREIYRHAATFSFEGPGGPGAAIADTIVGTILGAPFAVGLVAELVKRSRAKQEVATFAYDLGRGSKEMREGAAEVARRAYSAIADQLVPQLEAAHAEHHAARLSAVTHARELKASTEREAQTALRHLQSAREAVERTRLAIGEVAQKLAFDTGGR